MHRTQITLEDAQYLTLREQARRTGKSMGQLIREMLQRELGLQTKSRRKRSSGLTKLQGILDDPGFGGEDHDEILYGGR
jgi:predicted DNA-binding ribbon-helix-helix protein